MILQILYKRTDFDDKLKTFNKKIASNKTKHVEAEKKTLVRETDLTNKVAEILEKGYDFCWVECILQALMIIKFFQFFLQFLAL